MRNFLSVEAEITGNMVFNQQICLQLPSMESIYHFRDILHLFAE